MNIKYEIEWQICISIFIINIWEKSKKARANVNLHVYVKYKVISKIQIHVPVNASLKILGIKIFFTRHTPGYVLLNFYISYHFDSLTGNLSCIQNQYQNINSIAHIAINVTIDQLKMIVFNKGKSNITSSDLISVSNFSLFCT